MKTTKKTLFKKNFVQIFSKNKNPNERNLKRLAPGNVINNLKEEKLPESSLLLHPSWIAKQQRDKEQQLLLQEGPKNKKTKFVD